MIMKKAANHLFKIESNVIIQNDRILIKDNFILVIFQFDNTKVLVYFLTTQNDVCNIHYTYIILPFLDLEIYFLLYMRINIK